MWLVNQWGVKGEEAERGEDTEVATPEGSKEEVGFRKAAGLRERKEIEKLMEENPAKERKRQNLAEDRQGGYCRGRRALTSPSSLVHLQWEEKEEFSRGIPTKALSHAWYHSGSLRA